MSKQEFILIRHGETDYNRSSRFAGTTDVSLNRKGRMQIKNLRKKFKKEETDMIYSSNLKRCIETVKLLNLKAGINYSKNLQEMNFGRWEGLTFKEVEANYPKEVEEYKSNWTNHTITRGESFAEMSARVISEFERIKGNHPGKIAVVTHGGCIRAILGHYLMGSTELSWRFYIENGAVSRLCFDDGYVYLRSLNER